jgi:hypothetical protein
VTPSGRRERSRSPGGIRTAVVGWAAAAAALLPIACQRAGPSPYVDRIDLLSLLPSAERRAPAPLDESIRVERLGPPADLRVALRCETPARISWTIPIPRQARLSTAVMLLDGRGVTAHFYIGERTWEELFRITLSGTNADARAWHPVVIDLSGYAGWQWSLFYRPSEHPWRLNFYADPAPAGTLAWAAPTIQVR